MFTHEPGVQRGMEVGHGDHVRRRLHDTSDNVPAHFTLRAPDIYRSPLYVAFAAHKHAISQRHTSLNYSSLRGVHAKMSSIFRTRADEKARLGRSMVDGRRVIQAVRERDIEERHRETEREEPRLARVSLKEILTFFWIWDRSKDPEQTLKSQQREQSWNQPHCHCSSMCELAHKRTIYK